MEFGKITPLMQVVLIAGATAGVLTLAVISMQHGHYTIIPYFFLIPVLCVVLFWPKYGVIYSVIISWIYLTIVYFFFPGNLTVLADSTAWFYIIVSIGIVLSSFASGKKREEQKYRAIFKSSEAGQFTCTPDMKQITGSNPQLGKLLGYGTTDLQGNPTEMIFPHPAIRESVLSALRDSGHVMSREVQFQTQAGGLLWVLLSAAFVDETMVICSVLDLSDRKKAEETLRTFNESLEDGIRKRTAELNAALNEKIILLREVHHRVKNNLQTIVSLLNLQVRTIQDEKIRLALLDSRNRVRAMATVHQNLNESEGFTHVDLRDCVRSMILQIFRNYNTDTRKIRLVINLKDMLIEIDTAITICMILNELVTNSLKHAFPAGQDGILEIRGGRSNGKIVLVVGDNGIGMPLQSDWHAPRTLGMMIVSMLVQQMHGTIEQMDGNGTVFTIILEERPAVTIHSVSGLE